MKRGGLPVHGWGAFDKPVGVSWAQGDGGGHRAPTAEKAGHAARPDHLASASLPVALGRATKTVQWAMAGSKRYRMTVRWGEATATDDAEGAVTETSPNRPSEAQIRAALPQFTGDIMQVPSPYSAILVDGRRAYDLARAGETVELAARPIRIDRFELVACEDEDHAVFEIG